MLEGDVNSEKFQDPRTGEMVSRVKIPEVLLAEIEGYVQQDAEHKNRFLGISAQLAQLNMQWQTEFLNTNKSSQKIGESVLKIRDQMGLDSSWIYNIPLKIMEKREPPPEARVLPGTTA